MNETTIERFREMFPTRELVTALSLRLDARSLSRSPLRGSQRPLSSLQSATAYTLSSSAMAAT